MSVSSALPVIFFLVVLAVIWTGFTGRSRKREEFKVACTKYSQYGPFSIVSECLDQIVACNVENGWFIIVEARFPITTDSTKLIPTTYDRSVGFHKSQVKRIGRCSVVDATDSPSANSLSSFEITMAGPNDYSRHDAVVKLVGYRSQIDPWVLKTFGFQSNKPLSFMDLNSQAISKL